MKNDIFANFMEEKYNKENNYKKIILKTKEEKVMNRKRVLSFVAVFLVVVLVGIAMPTIYAKINWDIEFKEYQYIPREEAKGNLEEIRESDYAEVLNMDYLTQDGIGVKVDKILLTEDCLDADITFKFPENIKVNAKTFEFGHAVYDENKNIYDISNRIDLTAKKGDKDYTIPFFYEELGVKYSKRDIFAPILNDSESISLLSVNEDERTITCELTMLAKDSFPKSNKLYIRVFNLGYYMADVDVETRTVNSEEDFNVSNAIWIFEIDVPEKFHENKGLELKTLEELPEIAIEKINLTETCLVIRFNSEKYNDLVEQGKDKENISDVILNTLKVVDGEGKEYTNIRASVGGNASKITFDVGKKDFDKTLYLKYTIDGKEYTSQLVEK